MSRIARPSNTKRKMVPFCSISEATSVRSCIFKMGEKTHGKDNKQRQKRDREVGEIAKIVRLLLEDNLAFLWVIGPKN